MIDFQSKKPFLHWTSVDSNLKKCPEALEHVLVRSLRRLFRSVGALYSHRWRPATLPDQPSEYPYPRSARNAISRKSSQANRTAETLHLNGLPGRCSG